MESMEKIEIDFHPYEISERIVNKFHTILFIKNDWNSFYDCLLSREYLIANK